MNIVKKYAIILFFSAMILVSVPIHAATYYIATNGNDTTGNGSSVSPYATIGKALQQTVPGDIIIVRSGIYYQSTHFKIPDTVGTAASPITIRSESTLPGQRAVLTGGFSVTGWEQCSSNEPGLTVGGITNPNYANIYKAKVSQNDITNIQEFFLLEAGYFLSCASYPDLSNPGLEDVLDLRAVPNEGDNYGQSATLTDSSLNQVTPYSNRDGYWNGAFARIRLVNSGNYIRQSTILNYSASNARLTFASALSATLTSGDRYRITNHPHLINEPGEFCYTTTPQDGYYTIYLWPKDVSDLSQNIRIPKLQTAFQFDNSQRNNYIIDGFEMYGYTGSNTSSGGIICGSNLSHSNVTVQNCYVHDINGIGIYLGGGTNDKILNNTVENIWGAYGIALWCAANSRIENNTVSNTAQSAIYNWSNTQTVVIDNTVGLTGTHGNGVVFWQCDNSLLAYNRILNSTIPLSISESTNNYIWSNLLSVDGTRSYKTIQVIVPQSTGVYSFINNTIVGDPATFLGADLRCYDSNVNVIFMNNVVSGGATACNRSHNVFVASSTNQDALQSTERMVSDYNQIFENNGQSAYVPVANSYIHNTGGDISSYLPVDVFPNINFNRDLLGNARISDGAIDIGCIERTSGQTTNHSPVLSSIGPKQVEEENTLEFTINATDIDGDTLTYTAINLPQGATFDPDLRQFSWTPPLGLAQQQSEYNVTFNVSDGTLTDSETITITVLQQPDNTVVSTESPSAWYPFNQPGTEVSDMSANNNTGTCYGATWNDAAFEFDGVNNYIDIPDTDQIYQSTQQLTFSSWINLSAIRTNQTIAAKWDYQNQGCWALQTDWANASQIRLFIADSLNDPGINNAVTTNLALVPNQWYHIAFVYDGTALNNNNRLKIFIDGQQQNLAFTGTIPDMLQNCTASLKIGRFGGSLDRFFNGFIDDVRVYKNSLTSEQIQALYTKGRDDSLTAHFDLDDNFTTQDASVVSDDSGMNVSAEPINDPNRGNAWAGEYFRTFEDATAIQIDSTLMNPAAGTIGMLVTPKDNIGYQFLFGHMYQNSNAIFVYTLLGQLTVGLGNNVQITSNIAALQPDVNYHVALTWDGTSYAVYVDGQQKAVGTFSGLTGFGPIADIANIGIPDSRANNMGFDGSISDVRIYNRALSADEIAALSNAQQVKENRQLSFEVYGENSSGQRILYTADASTLPAGAVFDPATQMLTWTPWYDQAGEYQIVFIPEDQSDPLEVSVTVQDVARADHHKDLFAQGTLL